jgi:NTP pyrophosphatase (non-canonical NTP hydrolase)
VKPLTPEDWSLNDLMVDIRQFMEDRDWSVFHRPTALAISTAIETGELLELFQWRSDEEVETSLQSEKYLQALSDEIADVLIYILRLADVTGISPTEAVLNKMKKNRAKYPAKEWRGRAPNKIK